MTSSASSLNSIQWESLAIDVTELKEARWDVVNIIQWLARIANSFVDETTSEKRVVLEFRPQDVAFITQSFSNGITLEMQLPSLELQFAENGRLMPHVFDPEDHSPAEAEAWLLVELLHRGIDRSRFQKKLPYDIPDLLSGDAEKYSPKSHLQGLTEIVKWLRNASSVLESANRRFVSTKHRIICSPRTLHFTCHSDTRSNQSYFGFSLGDAANPEPFFFKGKSSENLLVGVKNNPILTAAQLLASRNPADVVMDFVKAKPE
jgi:hypothetical protein